MDLSVCWQVVQPSLPSRKPKVDGETDGDETEEDKETVDEETEEDIEKHQTSQRKRRDIGRSLDGGRRKPFIMVSAINSVLR
jgi:hypothetical protein